METLNPRASDFSWSSIPTELLRAELLKRGNTNGTTTGRPQCGSGKKGDYNTGAHVFALFLVLTLSTLACAFPIISHRSTKGGRRQRHIIFLCQHFGTGVLMATAFVHLLPTAFTSLTDPCLPHVFNKGYRPLAGLIAMASALVVVALESYLSTRGAGHSHSHHIWEDEDGNDENTTPRSNDEHSGAPRGYGHLADDTAGDSEAQGLVAGASPLPGSTPTVVPGGGMSLGGRRDDAEDKVDRESLDLEFTLDELHTNGGAQSHLLAQLPPKPRNHNESGVGLPLAPDERKRLILQCLLLEAGILFHSVFIGMAISVATGSTFYVFLTAICFHQSFEGLALGSRIAALQYPRSSLRPWLMVLAFGATTPLGQAIGLFIHRFYDPMSKEGLLMVGIMNAISSGLLLFAGLVQLLAEDFLTEKSYKTLQGRKRVNAFLAVLGGAGLMSAVGAFA